VTSPAHAVDNGNTTANVIVAGGLVLENLTASFTLDGTVGQTVDTGLGLPNGPDVTVTVITNSPTGYKVTITPQGTGMANGATTIPWATLQVADITGQTPPAPVYQPVAAGVVVHQSAAPSAPSGDAITNRYQIKIPAVPTGTYTGIINYLAATT
jgi:hypothetical protein